MKRFLAATFGVLVLACCWIVPQVARAVETPASDSAEVAALKRMGQEMGDAMIALDVATLDRMFADDWVSVGSSGKTVTKETMLQGFKSGSDKLESFELGPMDVVVLGNLAAVRGSVTERRHRDGKDASGDFLYMDQLEKRAGKWVVIRSTGMRMK
jgi:ketosteroid isomerase-like protein